LQEIPKPLDQILPTPSISTTSTFGADVHSKSDPESEEEIEKNPTMDGNHNLIPTWMSQEAMNLPRIMHDFPKCRERILTRFDHCLKNNSS